MILAAQAQTVDADEWEMPGAEVVVATGNVGHLVLFTNALHWRDIPD